MRKYRYVSVEEIIREELMENKAYSPAERLILIARLTELTLARRGYAKLKERAAAGLEERPKRKYKHRDQAGSSGAPPVGDQTVEQVLAGARGDHDG